VIDREFLLGVLLLDTHFERIKGEIGNPKTFPYPVIYQTVGGADVRRVIERGDPDLISLFIEAGHVLEWRGADLIATSCGFLARFQSEIAQALQVPFLSSSLLQLPLLYRLFGRRGPMGVITASKRNLSREHLRGIGAEDIPVRIAGMDTCDHFTGSILKEEVPLNPSRLREEVLEVARNLIVHAPEIPAFVLECTNLSPYRCDIRDTVKRPVFDIITLIESCRHGFTEKNP